MVPATSGYRFLRAKLVPGIWVRLVSHGDEPSHRDGSNFWSALFLYVVQNDNKAET